MILRVAFGSYDRVECRWLCQSFEKFEGESQALAEPVAHRGTTFQLCPNF